MKAARATDNATLKNATSLILHILSVWFAIRFVSQIMRIKNYFLLILFFHIAKLFAQTNPTARVWNAQAYGFIAQYHSDIDFKPSAGIGLSVGCLIKNNWLSGAAGLEYTRAAQTLILIDGSHETRVDIYQSFFALRGRWPIKKRWVNVFTSLSSGCSFFRPQVLILDAGTLGKLMLQPKSETKFFAAWGGGLTFRIAEALSVLFSIKQHFSRFAYRRLNAEETEIKWRPYWNVGMGLSWNY
jgi:hypothetical protein